MKSKHMVLVAFLTALAGSPAALAADSNMIGLETPNGKIAYDFINLWFNQQKIDEAWDKYVSHTNYMNHAVESASVNKHLTYEQEKEEERKATINPKIRFEIKQLVSQGDLVVAHIHAFNGMNKYGDESVVILRIRDGKVTDHWDMHSPLKEDSAVFVGLDR